MKKFLSLVLALVMTMSLVTISAGAKDFTDASKVNYAEAVDVISAVKVVDGYADGSFNPTATLTRGAAAKIICNLILGPTTASALVADAAPYKDVPADSTFAGYIAYCQKEGIISGYADGTFRPGNSLTGYAFMKMLLGALGYDAEVEGYTGANWSINVAKRALNIELNKGLADEFNGVKAVTREEAALYAFNTLKATMVEYESKTSISVGGADVVIAGSKAKDVTCTQGSGHDGNIGAADGKVQFAEKYFTSLKNYDVTNDFQQPATKWTLKAEKIGTYTKTADKTYKGEVKLGDIYADLNMSSKDSAEYYIDGADQINVTVSKGNEDKVGVGNGATTYVYHNEDNNDVTICTINTYVGTVNKTVAATSSRDAYIVVDASDAAPDNFTADFETDEEFEDDAVVLYTFSESAEAIKSVKVAEKLTGELTKIVATKSYDFDGTTYKFSKKIGYEAGTTMNTKSTYNFYLDNDGYVIYVAEKEFVSDDYAMVLAIRDEGAWNEKQVKLLKADGTVKTYTTDKSYATITTGDIVTWSYDEKADEVTLKEVAGGTPDADYVVNAYQKNFNLKNGTAQILVVDDNNNGTYNDGSDTRVYANSKTVFVVKNSDGDYTAYTGIKNVPSVKGGNIHRKAPNDTNNNKVSVAYYCKTSGMVTVMFIDASDPKVELSSDSTKAIYVAGESQSKLITDKATKVSYYEYNAVVDGEATTIRVKSDVVMDTNALSIVTGKADSTNKNYLYGGATYNADGIITAFSRNTSDNGYGTRTDKLSGEYTVKLGDESWTVDEDAKIWTIDEDGKITAGSISSVKKDTNDTFIYTAKDGAITNLFLQEIKTAADVFNATVKVDGAADDGSKVVVTVLDEDVKKGESIDFTVAPKAGYTVKSVKVGSDTLTAVNGVYTIENVTKDVEIKITTEGDAITTEVYIDGYNIYTANEDTDPVKVGVAIEAALEAKGYTNVSYTLGATGIDDITAKLGGGTVSFELNPDDADVAFISSGDSDALIAALDEEGVEEIRLTSGDYELDAAKTISGDLEIIGADGAVITAADSAIAFDVSGDANLKITNVTIEAADGKYAIKNQAHASGDLYLDGVTFVGGRIGVVVDGFDTVTITNCTFTDTTKAAISIGNSVTGNVTISGNTYDIAEGAVAIEYKASIVDQIKGTDFAALSDEMKSEI